MPLTISGSPNIAQLNSTISADLCVGKFFIDAIPTVYIGGGAANVLGAKIRIKNPYGVVVKDYAASYEIAPSMPSGMDTVVEYSVPIQGADFQYGKYVIDLKIIDSDSKEYVISKDVNVICIPNSTTKKFGSIGGSLSGVCKTGKVTVRLDTPPVYSGESFASQMGSYTLVYPTSSALPNLVSTAGSFSVPLYEGVYKITGESCVTYAFDDNVSVKIKYKIAVQKNILCGIDECIIYPRLVSLNEGLKTDCTDVEKQATTEIILEALNLFKLIQLGTDCGEDVSDYVAELLSLLNIQDSSRTLSLVGSNPATDFNITGCNVTKATVGLTDSYVIDNYEYVTAVADNGGAVVVSTATLNGCTKTQTITFDINAVYGQIKNIVNTGTGESKYWANVTDQGLMAGGADWTILGLTANEAASMTLPQKLNYLFNYAKDCCECTASITSTSTASAGGNVVISWVDVNAFAVEVYVDGIQKSTVLGSVNSYSVSGLTFGAEHTYTLIPRATNGKLCTPVAGTFNYVGCAAINPPSLSTNNASDVACPYNLTDLVAALPAGITAEWHNQNNTSAASLVGNPSVVASGVYYAFAKDSLGCYSTSSSVVITCAEATSCTEPQTLMVAAATGGNLVSFQGAASPPPSNSYLVKRKAGSAPDVVGSYTTLGVPVFNAGTNRYEILDTTSSVNTLYTYKAESQCASTKPYLLYNFANLTCPVVTPTSDTDSIDYSFTDVGGGVDKYEITLYNSTGLSPVGATQIRVPVFTNPITGTFTPLESGKDYKVRVRAYIGSYFKDCEFINASTQSADPCPVITGMGGTGSGGSA